MIRREGTRWTIEELGRVSKKDLLTEQKFYLHRRELLPRKLSQRIRRMFVLRMGQPESPPCLLGSSLALSSYNSTKSR